MKGSHVKAVLSLNLAKIVPGVSTPVLAKHSKHFSLEDALSIGVDRMQRNFEPMRRQVEARGPNNCQQRRQSGRSITHTSKAVWRSRGICAESVRALFQSTIRGVPAPNHAEPVECIYIGVQSTRSDPAIPSKGRTWKFS